jgi:hypothetical protein
MGSEDIGTAISSREFGQLSIRWNGGGFTVGRSGSIMVTQFINSVANSFCIDTPNSLKF